MLRQRQVCDYMTVAPHSIGLEQSLAVAARRMRELHARHLPVLQGGVLRGIISERDIALAESFELDPDEVTVEEAMTGEPYTITPCTPLGQVARAMAAHKYGCAVVMDGSELRGIFTTTDALRALAEVLDQLGPEQEALAPSQVREVMRAEHLNIRQLLERAEDQADRVLAGDGDTDREVRALRDATRQLYTGLCAHIELEDRVLAPALAEADAWGNVRASQLLGQHVEQRRAMEGALMELDDLSQPAEALAGHLRQLMSTLHRDLDFEEQALLCPDLLRDDPITENAETD